MIRSLKLALHGCLFLCFIGSAKGQSAPPEFGSREDCLKGAASVVSNALKNQDRVSAQASAMRGIKSYTAYVCYVAWDSIRSQLLTEAELNRMDKQPGATSNSSGSTSLVSKGSAPSLIGFALEHGGLTQT